MWDRSTTQSESNVSVHSQRLAYNSTAPKQPADVLEELQDLLEDYAPTWYTQEQREKIQSALRLRKRS
jgi:hypothetical protein